MPAIYEIRADYDRDTIVVYQAYSPAIAEASLKAGSFVAPFSFERMTWIKPSFLWLMERSNWARKSGQERVLGVRITRSGWEEALSLAVLTHPEPRVYHDQEDWRRQMDQSVVHVQWDPERSLTGASLQHRSIQVGLSRHIIKKYVQDWTVEIIDETPRVKKIRGFLDSGGGPKAKAMLPKENVYPVPEAIAKRLGMTR